MVYRILLYNNLTGVVDEVIDETGLLYVDKKSILFSSPLNVFKVLHNKK